MNTHESSRAPAEDAALSITGMTCSGCANTVKRVLSWVPGVTRAEVDHARGRATVSGTARPADLIAAVRAAGYGAQLPPNNASTGDRGEHGRNNGCC
jgi:copper chaperone CopZ